MYLTIAPCTGQPQVMEVFKYLTLNPVYNPGLNDISLGSVTLTLTASCLTFSRIL